MVQTKAEAHEYTSSELDSLMRLMDIAGRGVFLLDGGTIRLHNDSAQRLTGCSTPIVGRSISTIFHPEDHAVIRRALAADRRRVYNHRELHPLSEAASCHLETDFIPIRHEDLDRTLVLCHAIQCGTVTQKSGLSDEHCRLLSDAATEAVFLSENGRCVGQNKAAQEMFGYTNDEAYGRMGTDWIHPDDRETVINNMKSGYEHPYEVTALRKDGSTFPCEIQGRMTVHDGVPMRITTLRDLSERNEATRELSESEKRMRAIFEHSPLGVVLFSDDGTIVDCNHCFVDMMGSSREKLIGFNTVRESTPEMSEALRTALHGKASQYESEYTSVTGGKTTHIRVNFNPINPGQSPTEVIATLEDVSERVRSQRALRESEQRFRAMFEHMGSGVAVYEAVDDGHDFRFKDLNPTAEEITNIDRETVVGHTLLEQFPNMEGTGLLNALRRVWRTGESEHLPPFFYEDMTRHGWRENRVYRLPSGEVVAIFDDVTDRMEAMEALRTSEERLSLALRSANDGLWDWRLDSDKVHYSPRWFTMLGYEPDEFAQTRNLFDHLLHPDDLGPLNALLTEHMRTGAPFEVEFRMRAKDGSWRWILSRGQNAEEDSTGAPVRMIGTHTDITERKRMEEELRKAKEAAELASKSKSEFLANMSHEIRTPLNGIMGMIQLMQLTPLSVEQNEYADTAVQSCQRLTRLLGDILDLSKVEAGRMDLNSEPFEFVDAMKSVTALFTPPAQQKNLTLSMHLDPAIPKYLVGDAPRLLQVLNNLVGNAVKFTTEGEIGIAAYVVGSDESATRVLFTVADTGIGLSDENLETMFAPFIQGEQTLSKQYQGAGLGLSITQRLIKLMGGNMAVSSEQGKGTTFYVSIPLTRPHEDSIVPSTAPALLPEKSIGGLRILLAEDEKVNSIAITRLLEKNDCQVTTASNGQSALDILARQDFDAVLMDVQMPVMDGLEAVRAIRDGQAGEDKRNIRVIALTAYAMSGDKQRFLKAGMDDYLAKPVDMKALLEALKKGNSPGSREC